jgi:hypothetical protein
MPGCQATPTRCCEPTTCYTKYDHGIIPRLPVSIPLCLSSRQYTSGILRSQRHEEV